MDCPDFNSEISLIRHANLQQKTILVGLEISLDFIASHLPFRWNLKQQEVTACWYLPFKKKKKKKI